MVKGGAPGFVRKPILPPGQVERFEHDPVRRLGERGLRGAYFVYDLLSPFYEMLVALLCLRRDDRVWR